MKKCACIETLYLELPFEQRFAAAKADGFDSVEFWSWEDKDIRMIRNASIAAGIPVLAFSGDQDYSPIDPTHRKKYIDYARLSIEVAQKLEAKLLVLHSNAMDVEGTALDTYPELSYTRKILCMYEVLRQLAPFAEEAGVTFAVEALNYHTDHKGYFLRHTETGADMVRTLDSPNIKLLYDIYHMQINEGRLCDTIATYADCFAHVHVADVPGRHEPGTGEIRYSAVTATLRQAGYQGQLGFELFPRKNTEQAVKAIMELT